ncbi:MAG: cupin domain-containing protein [Betaproteobacteria bacterium]|nr:cupin domain-containing protein [Betaproteobacteria bacterium]
MSPAKRWLLAAAAASLCGGAGAEPPADVMTIFRWDDIKFVPNPLTPGAAQAVVSGDPKVPGQPYVVRVRFSPGTFSPPHFHPETRYIVVLKGTWWVGSGTDWDKSKTTPVPAGGTVVHYPIRRSASTRTASRSSSRGARIYPSLCVIRFAAQFETRRRACFQPASPASSR